MMGQMRRIAAVFLLAAVVFTGLAGTSGGAARGVPVPTGRSGTATGSGSGGQVGQAHVGQAGGMPEISSMYSTFLARHPKLGPVTVVDLQGTTQDERLLATTLQGIVNRSTAQMYLIDTGATDGTPQSQQFWLSQYEKEGLVQVKAMMSFSQAVTTFAHYGAGYVLASYSEPWTIDVATTIAAADGGVVATDATVPELQAAGLEQLDDTVGRWSDAGSAYSWEVGQYKGKLPYDGVAILGPQVNRLRDFLVQQGILALYALPGDSDFDQVYSLINQYPADHPIYGYIAQTGLQELLAINKLSSENRMIEASDAISDLSFHVAVGDPFTPPAYAPSPVPTTVPCTSKTVNVVVAITDGDALPATMNFEAQADGWLDPLRGSLPIGWSMAPALDVLAPAVWDYYARTAGPNNELIDMLGIGYTRTQYRTDAQSFFDASFEAMKELGLRAFWSLDYGLQPTAPVTAALASAAGGRVSGVLDGYSNLGQPAVSEAPGGLTILNSQVLSYTDNPSQIADQIAALETEPEALRPLVSFFSAGVWTNPAGQLIATLDPLAKQGVRFLTPTQAFTCLGSSGTVIPPPTSVPTAVRRSPQIPPSSGTSTTSRATFQASSSVAAGTATAAAGAIRTGHGGSTGIGGPARSRGGAVAIRKSASGSWGKKEAMGSKRGPLGVVRSRHPATGALWLWLGPVLAILAITTGVTGVLRRRRRRL